MKDEEDIVWKQPQEIELWERQFQFKIPYFF